MSSIWEDLDQIEAAVETIKTQVSGVRQRMIRATGEFYGPPPATSNQPVAPSVNVAHAVVPPQPAPVAIAPITTPVVAAPSPALPITAPASAAVRTTLGVKMTVFGNRTDEAKGWWKELSEAIFTPSPRSGIKDAFLALPTRQGGLRVELQDATADGTPLGPWIDALPKGDTGPWFDGTNGKGIIRDEWEDRFWETGSRPKAETLKVDYRGRETNGAGLDATPRAMALVKQYAYPGKTVDEIAAQLWDKPVDTYVNVRVIGLENESRITPHFTLEEMSRSAVAEKYGISNAIPKSLMGNIKRLCEFLEAVRAQLGRGFSPNQAYRSEALTEPMRKEGYKPATNSIHSKALAADLPRTQDFYAAITSAARHWSEPVLLLIEANPDHYHVALESVSAHEVKLRAGASAKAWERVGKLA